MKENVQQTLVETLEYLVTLVRDGIRPEDARSGLRPLQMRHSEVGIQLIWEEEPYNRSIHYDALLHLPEGTASLSYCDDRAMPWPLRGVHRWSDAELVRVNNSVLRVDQAIACLDFIWEECRITDQLVNICLVQEELEKHPIDLSDQELQRATDSFRSARKLYRAEDTYDWMERRGITQQQLERLAGNQATIAKLRDRLVGSRVQDYFDGHSADFDTAYIARFFLTDETLALETAERIRSGEVNFLDAAQCAFVTAKQSQRPIRPTGDGDLFSAVQRREAPVELRESLFGSAPGSVLGPTRDQDRYGIIRVLSVVPPTLDEPTRNSIKKILFEEWLEERRSTATVEWFWGNISGTAQVARSDASVDLSSLAAH
jgi:putative peptide maturation system protein